MLLVAAAASLGLGCERVRQVLDRITGTPREGAVCTAYSGDCVGPNEALICIDGKYIRRACENGCTSNARDMECVAGEGQRCAREEEGTGNCDARGGAMLVCERGVVRKQPCRGPDKCKGSPTGVECDGTIGIKGEKCSKDAIACAADG
ncbi:MAG: hypothetical protein HOV80_35705 [Polyangiaceae bacterium]|nr:hypothetical protein [Polyangiaceae bacterium]